MKLNFKKILLTGTALVAVSVISGQAQAAAIEVGNNNSVSNGTTITNADNIVDAVNDAGDVLDVNMNGTALTLGTAATTAGIDATGAGEADASSINFTNTSATAATVTVQTNAGGNSIITDGGAGNLTITLGQTSGAVAATGATNMTVSGNVAGAVKPIVFVTNGYNGNTLTFSGNTVNMLATGGVTLNGAADTVVFAGTAAQAVTGLVTGGAAGKGNVSVTNTGGTVTFNQNVGAGGDLLTFTQAASTTVNTKGQLKAQTITLNTGSTLTAEGAVTGAVTIGSTATLNTNAAVTGNITNSGTLVFNAADGGSVTGNVSGSGNITATGTGAITGTVSAGTVTVAGTKTLTNNAAAGANGTFTASSIVLSAAGSTLALNAVDTKSFTLTGAVTATVNGAGVVTLGGNTADVETYTVSSAIGTSTSKLASVVVGGANAAAVTANFSSDLYANAVTVGQGDIINLVGSTQTVSGTIDAIGTDGHGFVNVGSASVNSNVTFSGAIGATQDINGIKVFSGSTANISQNVSTHTGTNDIDGTLNINATANAVTFSATAGAGNTDIDGTVNITGTSTTTSDNVVISAAGALTIDGTLTTNIGRAGKTTTLGGAGGTSTIGATSNTTINAYNQVVLGVATTIGANGRTTTLNMGKTATFDPDATTVYTSGANVTLAAGSTLNVGIGSTSLALENNATVTVLTSAGGTNLSTALTGGQIVLVDTGLIDLQNDASDATNLKVKVVYNNVGTTLTSDYSENGATNLMALTTATDQLQTARGNLLAAPTAAAANEVAESLVPTVDGGHVVAAANVTNGSFGLMGDRLAALRTEQSGMAAGNGTIGNRLWAQGFGSMGDQDRRDGVDGYEADTFGGTIALDTETIAANGIVGVALSFANTEVDSKNANRTNTDVDTYQIALYGDYDLDQTTWLNGMVAYAWHDVNTIRHNVGGIAGLNASGDFDANQFTAQAEIGRDYTYESMILAPSFLAHWTHYDADGYTETGAGNAGLVVSQDTVNVFELGVGVDATWQYQTASGMEVEPSLHAGYRYDLVGDEVSTSNRFIGGTTAFAADGADPARSTFNVGAGMKLYTTDNWEFSANYDFEFKSDYDAHSGYLRAGVKF